MLALGLIACEAPTPLPVPLHGVVVVNASDRASPGVLDRMAEWAPVRANCVANAYGGIELAADVSPEPGIETVLVSYAQGVIVLAADGHLIASAPGFECTGSQDDVVSVEIVRAAVDRPLIVVAASQGGRRESSTWLELFAIGSTDHLERLFVGEIERHDGGGTHTGDVTILPGGLVFRHPTEGVSLWRYDARLGYVRADHQAGNGLDANVMK